MKILLFVLVLCTAHLASAQEATPPPANPAEEHEDQALPVNHWQATELIKIGNNVTYCLLFLTGCVLCQISYSAWGRWHKGD